MKRLVEEMEERSFRKWKGVTKNGRYGEGGRGERGEQPGGIRVDEGYG